MQKKTIKTTIINISAIFSIILIASFLGSKLDKDAELATSRMYKRDANGVIVGSESISYQTGKDHAIIFIHGFASSPRVFKDLINDIKDKANSDIFAPLLPYDGRDLQTLSKTNNEVVLKYLEQIITQFSIIYKKITIVGLSYGGAQLATLASLDKIPENAKIILYAPAFHISANNFWQRSFAKIYGHWRDYCDYNLLKCTHPNYANADASAKPRFEEQKDFAYYDIPATLTLFDFDLKNQNSLKNIKRPFSLIIAKNDNRVDYIKIKHDCEKNNEYCKLYSFKSGKHLIHWGKNKNKFEELILKINQ